MKLHPLAWLALVASAALTANAPASAQDPPPTGTVVGRVVDTATGEPVRSVVVTVSGTRLGALADSLGRYRISGVRPGRVELRARLVGWADAIDSVDVLAGGVVEHDFGMRTSAVTLGAIRAEARMTERLAFEDRPMTGVVTIPGRMVNKVPRLGEVDVLRAAQLLPGVQARNDFSAGLNVRGGEADQNLILMDGYPIFNPFHFGGLFGTFIDGAVGDLELLTGGFSARYGGRLSSVIDVRSMEETRPGLHGSSTLSLLAANATVGSSLPRGRGSWSVAARRTYADAVLKAFGNDVLPYHFRDAQAHATVRITPTTSLSTTLYNGRDALAVEASGNDEAFTFWYGNTVTGLTLSSTLANGLRTEHRLSWSGFATSLDLGEGSLRLDNRIGEWRLGGEVRSVEATHQRAFGYEATRDAIRYEVGITESDVALYRREQAPVAAGLYYDEIWNPSERLMLQLGARAEHVTGSGWFGLSPRASARWFLSSDLAINAAVGRYSQWLHSLAREDIPIRLFDFWVAADRHTPVSQATHYILGAESWFGTDRFLRVEAYRKDYGRLAEPNPGADPNTPGTEFLRARGTSWGVDVFLRQLELDRWGGWITYTYARNNRRADTLRFVPAHDRRHNLNAVLTWRPRPRLEVSGRWGYGSGTPYTDIVGQFGTHSYNIRNGTWTASDSTHLEALGGSRNAARYPRTHRLDFTVTRDFGGGTRITPFLSLINAYNAQNVFMYVFDYTSRPATREALSQLPLLPTFGVTVTF